MLPLSLYIHIPWCIQKCPYCDFNSHKSPENLPETDYIAALLRDLDEDLQDFPRRPLHSLFIGGGTPSLFSAHSFETLLRAIDKRLPFSAGIEITLEANPGTIDQVRFADYRALNINRLSLGIQSFNAAHLKTLGRIHDDQQAHRAIECARAAGFDNINLDLMYGLPHQTVEEGLQDLSLAVAHQPEHLSWYQLTLEPNTVFYKTRPPLPTEDDACQLEEEGLSLLAAHQFARYEISAFSQPNRQACHNMNYWLFGDYLGIGAGAHGKFSSPNQTLITRTQKQRQPRDYLNPNKPFLAQKTHVNAADLVFEFMLNTTRLEQPIPNRLFTERTGLNEYWITPHLARAEAQGLLKQSTTHWQITPLGRRYTNDLQALFLPA